MRFKSRNWINESLQMLLLLAFFLFFSDLFGQAYITYDLGGGRFGDHLLSYMHAKWLSFEYQIPLLYKPFIYSNQLILDEKETLYTPQGGNIWRINHGYETQLPLVPGLYECPYFPENQPELLWEPQFHFNVDWTNQAFRNELLHQIAPKQPLTLFLPPQDTIGIAIHVRDGGGYDDWNTRWHAPFKLPPLQFYLDALPRVLKLFRDKKIYVRLFTDALDPRPIAEALHVAAYQTPNLFIDYRKENNGHDINVLEDFFSLFHYDVLIRPQSNFSIIPSLLHDYAVVCSPSKYITRGRTVLIEEMDIQINHALID